MARKHYDAIDGLRTIACIGIVMMHMRANNEYEISGFAYDTVIASFTNFVFLFMVISAFGMSCGYLDKMLNNQISLEKFYAERYSKILPFFAVPLLFISASLLVYIIGRAGGYYRTDIQSSSAPSAWKYISHIWLCSVLLRKLG